MAEESVGIVLGEEAMEIPCIVPNPRRREKSKGEILVIGLLRL